MESSVSHHLPSYAPNNMPTHNVRGLLFGGLARNGRSLATVKRVKWTSSYGIALLENGMPTLLTAPTVRSALASGVRTTILASNENGSPLPGSSFGETSAYTRQRLR
jgi:hypothetical protein